MFKKLSVLICFVLILGLASNTFGADRVWDNDDATNLWNDANNWTPNQKPTHGENAVISLTDPSHCVIDAMTTAMCQHLNVGTSGFDGELWMTGGSLSAGKAVGNYNKTITIGNDANGIFKLSDGDVVSKVFRVGHKAGSANSSVEMTGGSITTSGGFQVGNNKGTGSFDMQAGDVNCGSIAIGNLGGTGTFDMQAGAYITSAHLGVGTKASGDGLLKGDGTFNMYGGTIDVGTALDTKALRIGYQGGATGLVDMDDGTINVSGTLNIGAQDDSIGTLTMSGGTINVGEEMRVGNRDANGFVTMSGGNINVLAGDLLVGRTYFPGDPCLAPIPGTGYLTMTSGLLIVADTNTIYIGTDGSTGTVSLSGDAVLQGGDLVIGPPGSGGILDMCGDAQLVLVGEGLGDLLDILGYIEDGLITVCGSVKSTDWAGWGLNHDNVADTTTLTVPEPATIALLGLGGLVLLRRKRR